MIRANADSQALSRQATSHRVIARHLGLAVSATIAGILLAGCGSGGGSDEPDAGCLPLAQMAAIVTKAEREFATGSRTLGDQLEGFDEMEPLIEQIVTECNETDHDQGFMLAARYGVITNALRGS